jgi:C1A family cysteine protease
MNVEDVFFAASLFEGRHTYGKRWPGPAQRHDFPRTDVYGLKIASQVDPRDELPPLFNQGQLGSCTANATSAAFQYESILDGKDCGELARLWVYYFERKREGTLGQGDVGAMGHDAFTVARHGIPDETLWPYVISTFQHKPGADFPRAYTLSKQVSQPPQSEAAIKQVLSNSQTIAYGFTVYESFEEPWETPGVMPMPQPGEQVLGGHENLWVGYLSDYPGYLLSRNSWNPNKNDKSLNVLGYFLMPIAYALDQYNVSDLRTIVRPL